MRPFAKALVLFTAAACAVCTSVRAADGIFGSYVVLNANGGGNTFYDLSSATTNPDFSGTFLGTFNPGAGNTLVIAGGEVDTFKNGSSDIFGANTVYTIHLSTAGAGAFTSINLPFKDQFPAFGGNAGDQRWQNTTNPTNVLTGLANGTYSFEVYSTATSNDNGTLFANAGGSNYIATFTVVPEPATCTTLALGAAAVAAGWFRRRRS